MLFDVTLHWFVVYEILETFTEGNSKYSAKKVEIPPY